MKRLIIVFNKLCILLSLLTALSPLLYSQQYTPDANTAALWHFNETSGSTVADTSGNGNTGTATGTTIALKQIFWYLSV